MIHSRTARPMVEHWARTRAATRTTQEGHKRRSVNTQPKQPLKAVVEEPGGIFPEGSGVVRIWKKGEQTERTEEAWFNWLIPADQNEKISNGKQVIIQWFSDERKWIITHAQCED